MVIYNVDTNYDDLIDNMNATCKSNEYNNAFTL